MPRAVGHRDTEASRRQHAAQLTYGRIPVRHVIEHVRSQHDVKHAIAYWQRGDISTEQRRMGSQPQHPRRQVTPAACTCRPASAPR